MMRSGRSGDALDSANDRRSRANLSFAALAVEFAPHGVTVNCIAPGQIDTGMTDAAANAACLPRIPVGRLGLPEDIAGAVAYLVSDAASFVTGATLDVTGGSFMA